ncbi:MAG: hypothetical protein H0U29_14420 [Acidimicrobiia bacterium]|nr:hypothetical protein [Acidimicrobiia bacterium]
MTGADDGGRARHPSARARGGHLTGPVARLAPMLAPGCGPHRDVAWAVVAVRGAEGRSPAAFRAAYGLAAEDLDALEDGRIGLGDLPATLRVLTPVVALARALQPRAHRTDTERPAT